MTKKKALLLGASSLAGRYLLKLLLQDDAYDLVTIYARHHVKAVHSKLVEKIIDQESIKDAVEADDIFCCIDADIKKAGSQLAMEQADLDFPLKVAKLQKANGSSKFLVISTMGADIHSQKPYNQIKAKMEDAVKALGYSSLYIFRPAIIRGSRKEQNFGNRFKNSLLRSLNPLFVGPLEKYQSVSAKAIGRAMIYYAVKNESATRVILSSEIKEFEL